MISTYQAATFRTNLWLVHLLFPILLSRIERPACFDTVVDWGESFLAMLANYLGLELFIMPLLLIPQRFRKNDHLKRSERHLLAFSCSNVVPQFSSGDRTRRSPLFPVF